MLFNFFKKLLERKSKTSSTSKKISVSHKNDESSTFWPNISANEIFEKVEEARNSGKHHIMFNKATISKSTKTELCEAGLRIKISKSSTAPHFEVFC